MNRRRQSHFSPSVMTLTGKIIQTLTKIGYVNPSSVEQYKSNIIVLTHVYKVFYQILKIKTSIVF